MAAQRPTTAAAPTPAPEECKEDELFAEQSRKNLKYLVEILDDLEREHPRRLVMVYGDHQVLIGDDSREMEQSLTEAERRTVVLLPIGPWTEYAVC